MVFEGLPGILHASVTKFHCDTVEYFAEFVTFLEVLVYQVRKLCSMMLLTSLLYGM